MFDEDQKVAGLVSTNPKYCLNNWLCPGDRWSLISERIRPEDSVSIDQDKVTIYGDSCWVTAARKQGRVKSIELTCQP